MSHPRFYLCFAWSLFYLSSPGSTILPPVGLSWNLLRANPSLRSRTGLRKLGYDYVFPNSSTEPNVLLDRNVSTRYNYASWKWSQLNSSFILNPTVPFVTKPKMYCDKWKKNSQFRLRRLTSQQIWDYSPNISIPYPSLKWEKNSCLSIGLIGKGSNES